ncbi:MAG TPA: hypothetical protein PKW35_01045 [Nannocystaceae bacterium]|nr:hypothetical protein [Nannocystaceae bacterium]
MIQPPKVTRAQVLATEAVVGWYLDLYYGTPDDPGVPKRFTEPEVVGPFAVRSEALAAGEPEALFQLLVTTTMFQRRQDQQILRILRSTPPERAHSLTDAKSLLQAADDCGCINARTNDRLISACDLTKHPETRRGVCSARPEIACDMKSHSEWLKRYGHFGKVPTSAALNLRERGVADLGELYRRTLAAYKRRRDRAQALEEALSSSWRVNSKIACMFLSAVSNPDLAPGMAPWTAGLDWRRYIVIDSNVDLFLRAINYQGAFTYDARREFLSALSQEIDLRARSRRLHADNPRIVQQAMFVFMSVANRRASTRDCMFAPPSNCRGCPQPLRRRCAARPQ